MVIHLLIILSLLQNVITYNAELVVEANVGTIKGLEADDGDYYMYKGVPYGLVDPNNPFGVSIVYSRNC